jgi:hypothetical protein
MLTDAQLKAWKSATDGATEGPWEVANVAGWLVMAGPLKENTPGLVRGGRGTLAEMDEDFGEDEQEANALFFAVARTAMPALLDEVQRLRTPASGNVGRSGFEAFYREREADGAGHMPAWKDFQRDATRLVYAWMSAGHAERAVAYAQAAQHIAARKTWVAHDGREVLAGELRALERPPKDSAERLARISALLREAGALSVEVLADGDAPEEHRVHAEAIHKGIQEASDRDERPNAAHLRCWDVRRKHGPTGDDVPPSSEALKGAQASAATALEMTRLAARRSSSAPLGRALGALETAQEQLAAAVNLDPAPAAPATVPVDPGWQPSSGRVPFGRQPTPDVPPLAEDEKTPTEPSEPLKEVSEGQVWLDRSGMEWKANPPDGDFYFFVRIVKETDEPDATLGTGMAEHPSTRGWRLKDGEG